MKQTMGRAEEGGLKGSGQAILTWQPRCPGEWGWGTDLFGQAGLAPPGSPASTLHARLSFLPFLPEVGKTLGLP